MFRAAIAAALLAATPAHAQPYAEAFAGMAAFDSTAHAGGARLVDQGGDATMAGVRAGWRVVPAIGAGAEIPFARTWFVRLDGTYAANGVETYQGTLSLGARF